MWAVGGEGREVYPAIDDAAVSREAGRGCGFGYLRHAIGAFGHGESAAHIVGCDEFLMKLQAMLRVLVVRCSDATCQGS
jgi:hypothetical protein